MESDSIATFKSKLKTFMFVRAFDLSDQRVNEGYKFSCVLPWIRVYVIPLFKRRACEFLNFSFERMGTSLL